MELGGGSKNNIELLAVLLVMVAAWSMGCGHEAIARNS